jgi:lysylphosphatidylglycerol synthetase-like protein (DUF2156 family)
MKLSSFQMTRYLLWFTVAILVAFGVGSLLRITANPDRTALYVFYALLMFGDVAVLLFCALQMDKRTKLIYFVSVVVLALNIVLTIFDQFGLVDFLFLTLNLITLIALITARREFLPA